MAAQLGPLCRADGRHRIPALVGEPARQPPLQRLKALLSRFVYHHRVRRSLRERNNRDGWPHGSQNPCGRCGRLADDSTRGE